MIGPGRQRRGWGAIVIVFSLIVAVAGPRLLGSGNEMAGRAVRGPVPPPPMVGDCVVSAVDPDGSALQFMVGSIASASVGLCADADVGGGHAGEIVEVISDPRSFPRSGSAATASPDPRACQSEAADYVGWPDRSWVPATSRTVVLLGPDRIQYVFGQQWLACAIIPGQVGYTGSLRGGSSRPAADAYGQCRLSAVGDPVPIACSRPHDIEIFGAAVGDAVDGVDLNDSCVALLTEVTGIPGLPMQPLDVWSDPDRTMGRRTCGVHVVGAGQLRHSLLHWGSAPLPWS